MKQTAVEWLSQELNNIIELYPSEWEKINKVFEQAKEMEKQEIVDAWDNGKKSTQCKAPICQRKTGLEYFNKKFNTKSNESKVNL